MIPIRSIPAVAVVVVAPPSPSIQIWSVAMRFHLVLSHSVLPVLQCCIVDLSLCILHTHPYPSRHAHATLTIIPVVARAAFLLA